MTARALAALGVSQCVNWGVLYYAFAVLVAPVQRELGVQTWVVTGAFSLALVMSALAAPAVGAWADRDRAALLMQIGGVSAVALLGLWTLIPTVAGLYAVWGALGLCMSATLYEPAFAIIGRAHSDPTARLRALAILTVFGGLASTVFLPLTAVLIRGLGWRGAVGVLAAILTAATCLSRIFALRSLPTTATASVPARLRTGSGPGRHVPQFGLVLMTFALGSLASAAFTVNFVPALGEQGVSLTAAAMFGGLLGVMQLPGRLLLMSGPFAGSPARLVLISLLLQGVGLAAVALAGSVFVVGGGITTFAVGAGLLPLVRPHLVQTVFDVEVAGYLNGRLALVQQLARASGPVLTAFLAAVAGYRVVFALLAVTLAAVAVASHRAVNRLHSSITHERSRHDPTAQPATIVG